METEIMVDDMIATDVAIDKVMPSEDVSVNTMAQIPGDDFGSMNEEQGFKMSNNLILGIVIGVCIILGIVLGIILGRRAARK